MRVNKEGNEYLIVEIPKETKEVFLSIPYNNIIRAAVPIESNPNVYIINTITCEEIIPNSKEYYYSIVGMQSKLNFDLKLSKEKEYVIIMVKEK